MRTRPDRPGVAPVRTWAGGRTAQASPQSSPSVDRNRAAHLDRTRPTVMRIAALSVGLATVGCTMGIAPRSILTPGSAGAGETAGSPIALPPEITSTPTATPTPGTSPTPTALGGGGPAVLYHSRPPGEEEIVLLGTAGGSPIDLSNSRGSDITPRFSPDGSRFAFASDRDGDLDIYLMDPDGSNLVNLTQNEALDDAPSWSPDGGLLVFSSDRDGNREIYRMR